MEAQIELVLVLVRNLEDCIFVLPFVKSASKDDVPNVRTVDQPETVVDEGKLHQEAYVEVLLGYQLRADYCWPACNLFGSQVFKEDEGRRLAQRDEEGVDEHE